MSDSVTGNGHDDLNQAMSRFEAYLERLEAAAARLEEVAEMQAKKDRDAGR